MFDVDKKLFNHLHKAIIEDRKKLIRNMLSKYSEINLTEEELFKEYIYKDQSTQTNKESDKKSSDKTIDLKDNSEIKTKLEIKNNKEASKETESALSDRERRCTALSWKYEQCCFKKSEDSEFCKIHLNSINKGIGLRYGKIASESNIKNFKFTDGQFKHVESTLECYKKIDEEQEQGDPDNKKYALNLVLNDN